MKIQYRLIQRPDFTIDDVRRYLRKFSVVDGLQVINRLSRRLYFTTPTPGMVGIEMGNDYTITEWDLAFIAKELILSSNDHRSGLLSVDAKKIRHALFLVSNMRDPVLRGEGGITHEQRLYSLARIAYQQFRHQGWWRNALPRTYLLYEKTWRRLPSSMDLSEASMNVFGMPLPTFLALGTALYGLAGAEAFASFLPTAVANIDPKLEGLRRLVTDDVNQSLWSRAATDYPGFRQLWQETREDNPAYACFEFNPLERRPVILTQPPVRCVVPSLSSLLLRFTDGIYHDFFNYYKSLGDHGKFTIPFGEVFQEYVGWQLRSHFDDGMIIPDREYRVGRDMWKGPDWIAIEDDSALLIECKAARLMLPGKVTGEKEAIENDVKNKLVPVVAKFAEKIAHIRARPDDYPKLHGVSNFYPVVVTLDPWWPAESFHHAIDEELTRRGIARDPYHVISIDGLEKLLPLAAVGIKISGILQERIDRGQQGYFFGEELSAKIRDIGGLKANKLLDEAFSEFFAPFVPSVCLRCYETKPNPRRNARTFYSRPWEERQATQSLPATHV